MNATTMDAATPGERLRRERELRSLGLQQVADALHVEARLLEALEQNRFAAFDAPVYAKGYLRKYATYLAVPVDEIIAAYEGLHDAPAAPTLIPAATARDGNRDYHEWRLPLLALAMLIVIGGSFWWWFASTSAPSVAGGHFDNTTSAPHETASTATSSLPSMMSIAESAVPSDRQMAAANAAFPVAAEAPLAQAAPVTPAPVATPAGPAANGFSINYRADCWTEVYDSRGERLYYDLGNRGETRTFAGRGPWRVFLGMADAARVVVAGQNVRLPASSRRDETARFVLAGDGTVR